MLDEVSVGTTFETATGTYKRKKMVFVARRVIVKLDQPEGDSSLAAAVDGAMSVVEGAQVLRAPGKSGRMVMLIPAGQSVPNCAKKVHAMDGVEYAEPDVIDTAQIVPNDPSYASQWALPKVNAEAAWDLETGKSNVVIGVIDSGISMTAGVLDHDDLSTPGRITLGTDFVDGGTPRDTNGHGTHVAGIAAAAGNNSAGIAGMNWASPLYICRTLDTNGSGSSADFADAVEEITDWAVANGKKAVINYSGGGGANQTKKDACQYASDNGMLLVAATGNDNGNPVIWPAAYSTIITGVVAVGSTTSSDTVSSFSNIGPEVTVVAPGSSILSTAPTYTVALSAPPPAGASLPLNYGTLSGTSMATPLVSGLAALMWSRHPSHTNQKVKQCLQDTAVELGTGNFNNSWGFGRVDAHAALKCGDMVILPVTHVGPTCPPVVKTWLVTSCWPTTAICPSRVSPCVSKLPNLCPTTRISNCWSHLMCVEPVTKIQSCSIFTTRICPSAVDACPSAPGGCDWEPIDPWEGRINPVDVRVNPGLLGRIGNLEARFAAMEQELWYDDESEADDSEEDGGWFYVDDDGGIHEV